MASNATCSCSVAEGESGFSDAYSAISAAAMVPGSTRLLLIVFATSSSSFCKSSSKLIAAANARMFSGRSSSLITARSTYWLDSPGATNLGGRRRTPPPPSQLSMSSDVRASCSTESRISSASRSDAAAPKAAVKFCMASSTICTHRSPPAAIAQLCPSMICLTASSSERFFCSDRIIASFSNLIISSSVSLVSSFRSCRSSS